MKKSNQEIINLSKIELNNMPLDFPVVKWGEKYADIVVTLIRNYGRKNATENICLQIEKILQNYPSSVVNNWYAVQFVMNHIYNQFWD